MEYNDVIRKDYLKQYIVYYRIKIPFFVITYIKKVTQIINSVNFHKANIFRSRNNITSTSFPPKE